MSEQSQGFDRKDFHKRPQAELQIRFSPEADIEVVQQTLKELDELKEQGYAPHLPPKIKDRIAQGQAPTVTEVAEAVDADYAAQEYEAQSADISRGWSEQQEEFLQKLSTLGLPLQEEYQLRLTKYGVGGEYHQPNTIIANIEDSRGIMFTIAHEIIHLTIENLVEEHRIDHWTKERMVDRIFEKFYPDRAALQRDPPNAQRVDKLFDEHFPNVQKIITELVRAESGDT